jgi:hypothetical protein
MNTQTDGRAKKAAGAAWGLGWESPGGGSAESLPQHKIERERLREEEREGRGRERGEREKEKGKRSKAKRKREEGRKRMGLTWELSQQSFQGHRISLW